MIGIFVILAVMMCLVVKFCKKTVRAVLSILIVLTTLYCVIVSIDMNRVESFREPIFVINKTEDDLTLKTINYQGLGYNVKEVKDLTNGKTIKIEMYMFNKCIAGAIE